jgi:hypothetical protein
MARSLDPAPPSLVDVSKPRFGSFRGGLPILDLGPSGHSRLWDLAHKKRWVYAAAADADVFTAVAIVSVGYASNAIIFALDRRSCRMLFDRSIMGPASAASFDDSGAGRRGATFKFGRARARIGDDGMTVDVSGRGERFHVGITRRAGAPDAPPIGAVVPIQGGYASATEKRIADCEGEVVAEGKRFVLSDALLGLDHTSGFLARHTVWRWAFGLGRTERGERLGFNLVEGFVGEAECGAWVGSELVGLGEARFTFDDPMAPWRIETSCGGLRVTFHPAGIHSEHKNLGVVRSKFIQPVGSFEGELRAFGRTIPFARMAGVTEHQDVVW